MTVIEGMPQGSENYIDLSVRGAGTIKLLEKNILAVGGADGIVDIFTDCQRLMTLIP